MSTTTMPAFDPPLRYENLSSSSQMSPNALSHQKLLLCGRGGWSKCKVRCSSEGSKAAAGGGGGGGHTLDRRKLLLSSSSTVVGVAGLISGALAAPVQPPDLRQCTTPIDPGNGAASVNCCLPAATTIKDFVLPSAKSLRTRPPAHLASQEYVAKYKRAYQLLRALPASDPRQYAQQANVHCAFCDAAYDEQGTGIEYQVHSSWLFFPWHRWYLYFHERILAKLLNDDTFALPFWNWDAAPGYSVPPLYSDAQSPLYDANRNPAHRSPAVVDLNYNFTERNRAPAAQLTANNTVMYRQLVTNAKTPSLFFGQAYRQGGQASPGAGTVENIPHGTVHVWTGNPSNPNDEDMGTLYSAARDPIFFAHHANIDRLWEVWKGLGGRRQDLTDGDYLNATFLFYDENSQLVRVKVRDALDIGKLGYNYQAVTNPWLNAAPSSAASGTSSAVAMSLGARPAAAMASGGRIRAKIREGLEEFKERVSKKIDKVVSALVKRPKKVRADDFEEEILVLEGVEVPTNERVKFDVYINLPEGTDEAELGCEVAEYAGSFFNVPHMGMDRSSSMAGHGKRLRKSNFRLGIGEVLKELGVEDDDSFSITIVPRGEPSLPVSIDSIKLEYE